jgi:hypothetical protein
MIDPTRTHPHTHTIHRPQPPTTGAADGDGGGAAAGAAGAAGGGGRERGHLGADGFGQRQLRAVRQVSESSIVSSVSSERGKVGAVKGGGKGAPVLGVGGG